MQPRPSRDWAAETGHEAGPSRDSEPSQPSWPCACGRRRCGRLEPRHDLPRAPTSPLHTTQGTHTVAAGTQLVVMLG